METTPITTSATGQPVSSGQTASKAISSDFDTFLRMLTVQMQNQDPLNPIESTDFAVQLATFSGVEQQVQTNDLLKALSADQNAAGLAQMAGWVGKEARAAAPAYFDGSPLTINTLFGSGADRGQLLVRDSNGAEVQRLPLTLSDEIVEWAGVDSSGAPLPAGTYQFDVISFSGDQQLEENPAEVYGRVTEVRLQDGETVLIMQGDVSVATSDVTALRDR